MKRKDKQVEALYKTLRDIGPLLPGSLSEQWNVCGKPDCRCKDPDNPQKHGPYYQLSYTIGGKSSSFFVKKADLPEVRRRMENYRKFRKHCGDLFLAWVDLARKEGFSNCEDNTSKRPKRINSKHKY